MSGHPSTGGRYVCSSPVIPEKRKLTRAGIQMRPASGICETVLSGTNSIISIPSSQISPTGSKISKDQLGVDPLLGGVDTYPDDLKMVCDPLRGHRGRKISKHLKVTQTGSLDITPGSRSYVGYSCENFHETINSCRNSKSNCFFSKKKLINFELLRPFEH